ncbi:reverse transcriptase domain-containing protein [Tanacetum coccineum]|uniref:Reverse transcriptase domain-containing protein n=1 Tax=Tanacetum coccineum TaxID=301880 RepID=A0ABQ5CZZ8_9ASTR
MTPHQLVERQQGCVRLVTTRHGRCLKADHSTFFKCKSKHHLGSTKAKSSRFEKSKAVMKEVEEWIKEGSVRPVQYPTWISNPVLVKKIEAVMGFPFKYFLDAYKGYHQIQMSDEDEEKTVFYTEQGTYCYTKMSFGLKNAEETYQRLVYLAFQAQLGRNLEAYVDDMVIKIKTEQEMTMDISKTFDNLRKVTMKLNPKKCSFKVKEGKLLGYMVTSKGIQANPKKTKAVTEMRSPKTLKEMQSLTGKLAASNRFLSRSAERALPFFETLKNVTKENKDDFRWTKEAEQAFQEMKKLIMELPTLTTPGVKETLYVYLTASKDAWGLDILGPLSEGLGRLEFFIVAIDYFTKWMEAKPLAKTPGKEVKKFVWENIVCRFGLPRVIVTDNETQLVNDPFKSWCEKWKIKQMNTTIAHPQANGLVERGTKSLMHNLKARLGRERVGWVDELPNILWAHRTMLKTSNGETPFNLTYRSEAVIPVEIGMPTYRTIQFNEAQNEKEMRLNLDIIQEMREIAAIREAKYKKKVEQYYNKWVRPMSFNVGDFVYQRNEASRVKNQGKLGPNWEGPYRVVE